MSWDPTIDDEAIGALLAGDPKAAEANLDLTRFVQDLRTAFPADAPAAEAHLAAIMETARLSADNGDPAAMPASNADAPAAQVSWLPKRKGNHMRERKWRVLVLRVAAPIVALFTVLGIMGSAGALPRGLQRLTSNAAGVVGFDLPSGEDEGDATATTEDDQGENVDDQGENVDDQGDTTTGDSTDQGDQNDQGDSTSSDQGNQDDQGDSTSSDSSDTTSDDQGDQDDQGDSTSGDQGNQDDQGDSTSGDQGDQDDQGDSTSSDQGNQDDQGDSSGDSGSGDSGSSGSGGDNNQD